MTVQAELQELQERGIQIFLEGDRLHFRDVKGSLTDADHVWLSERRAVLVELLRADTGGHVQCLPLSVGQQAMWIVERFSPGGSANNLAFALRIGVAAEPQTMQAAFQATLDRHPMLRATFHVDEKGELYQQIASSVVASISVHDATNLSEAALDELVNTERDRPLDLEKGPPVRLVLFRFGEAEHLLLFVAHHIVSDGGSIIMLMAELILSRWMSLRGGDALELPSSSTTYADYIDRQTELLAGPGGEELWNYWREQLQAAPAEVPLALDRRRESVDSFRGASVPLALNDELVERLTLIAPRSGVTKFVLFITLYQIFLARISGVKDVVVGSAFSDRTGDSRWVVGDYINALPIRARLRWGMTVREALLQQKAIVGGALKARAYPVQRLIERLHPERSSRASPLFNCYFNYAIMPVGREMMELMSGSSSGLAYGGINMKSYRLPQIPGQFDLTFSIEMIGKSFEGRFDYAAGLFDHDTIERLAGEFVTFLRWCADNPNAPLLPQEQRSRQLEDFNASAKPVDNRPFIIQLLERGPAHADKPALLFGADMLDYSRLLGMAQGLAKQLRNAGAGRGAVVGIAMDRSPAMLAAMLAVQLSGAAYVPLDPAYPDERLSFMADDSGIEIVISDRGRPDWAPAHITVLGPDACYVDADPWAAPANPPMADDLAYILYTSGSTGKPKGVRISHGALANFLSSMLVEPGIGENDILAAITTISFDIAGLELYLPLLAGATIDLLPREIAIDGVAIAARCAETGVTMLQATPTQWRQLAQADWNPAPGFGALSGGEPLPADLAAILLARGVTLWNLYGPTETTIWSMVARIRDATSINVGHPIANTRVYVLDEVGDLAPIGQEGEIWIGGSGLAQGYHDRPELTAERFLSDPFAAAPEARMYRTGDIGYWRQDGSLIHLGRSDDQIKLRGYRIELSEIETVLMAHDHVGQAVVVPRQAGDDVRLVAFVVPASGQMPTPKELRSYLRQHLPEYMVPAMFVDIAEVPMTLNGKIDRKSLPNPFAGAPPTEAGKGTLEGELENRLATIWQEALNIAQVGPGDNFFELGGHSLLAVKVTTLLERQTGHRLPPEMLFFHTLREIAAGLQSDDIPRAKGGFMRQVWRGRRRAAV